MPSKTDEAENGCQSQSHEGQGDQGSPNVVVDLMAESDPDIPPQSSKDARKILTIVAIELAFVFVVSSGFFFNPTEDICTFVKSHQWISGIALVVYAIILLTYSCWLYFGGGGSGPLLSPGNLLIFALTTLCLTLICVFMTICSDGLILICALGSTLGVLFLVIAVAVLTPLNTRGWGNQLMILAIVLFLTGFFILLTVLTSVFPISIEVQNRIFIIILCVAVIITFFYTLYTLQTFGEIDTEDGCLWVLPCIMLPWILNLFLMVLMLCGLIQLQITT